MRSPRTKHGETGRIMPCHLARSPQHKQPPYVRLPAYARDIFSPERGETWTESIRAYQPSKNRLGFPFPLIPAQRERA